MSIEDDLRSFVAGVPGFAEMGHADKVRLFAWLQHHLFKKDRFSTADINWCYDKLSFEPSNTSQYLKNLEKSGELLKDTNGYRSEGKFRADYDTKYGVHQVTLQVRDLVKNLVNDLPELAEKDIYQEAMTCLKYDAGRAAMIMVWNIAFYHLCQLILKHRLKDFNDRMPTRFPGKWKAANGPFIKKYEDFGDEMNESQVIEVVNSAGIIDGNMYKVYSAALGKRNSVAHPSTQHVTQVAAEGYIDELINNTVKLLKI
jgi:hypothetical protein